MVRRKKKIVTRTVRVPKLDFLPRDFLRNVKGAVSDTENSARRARVDDPSQSVINAANDAMPAAVRGSPPRFKRKRGRIR